MSQTEALEQKKIIINILFWSDVVWLHWELHATIQALFNKMKSWPKNLTLDGYPLSPSINYLIIMIKKFWLRANRFLEQNISMLSQHLQLFDLAYWSLDYPSHDPCIALCTSSALWCNWLKSVFKWFFLIPQPVQTSPHYCSCIL